MQNDSRLVYILIAIIVVLLITGAYFFGVSRQLPQTQPVDWSQYPTPTLATPNNNTQAAPAASLSAAQTQSQTSASSASPALKTYTYTTGSATVSFSYPSDWTITSATGEIRPGVSPEQITEVVPLKTESQNPYADIIYLGIPYTGAVDPTTQYDIMQNSTTGVALSISLTASSSAQAVFQQIIQSAGSSGPWTQMQPNP